MISRIAICLLIIALSLSCNSGYTVKPKDYPRIDFPEKKYQPFSDTYCPITFEYPVYADISRDSLLIPELAEHPCWVNIMYPDFNATIYLSYKMLDNYKLDDLRNKAHKMTYEHAIKADYIEPVFINTDKGSLGILYHVGGDAASPTQFYITDTISHFIRGALYFKESPNSDSLAPVIRFINDDILHLIHTARWEYPLRHYR